MPIIDPLDAKFIIENIHICIRIFYSFSISKWRGWLKSFLVEYNDLFILFVDAMAVGVFAGDARSISSHDIDQIIQTGEMLYNRLERHSGQH